MATNQNKQALTIGSVATRLQSAWKALLYGDGKSWLNTSWDSPYTSWGSYGTNIDYQAEAGDLARNAIVMTVVQSIMRAAPEAPPKVMRTGKEGSEVVPDHPLIRLLKRPNKYYSGRTLMQALYCSYNLTGWAYWLKARNGSGRLVELWYEPPLTCRPRWEGDGLGGETRKGEWISHYEVWRNPPGKWIPIPIEDVVHFRFGLEGRQGLNPLQAALREVYTDNEAARYTATVLKNMGVPGVVISPEVGGRIEKAEELKTQFMAKFGGDKRGEPMIASQPLKVEILSFSPEQMSLKDLRRLPEERIPALLSWPAVVAGLGAGLDASTYNNMDEARQQAYEQNIIPTQQVISDTISMQLLGDLGDPETEEVVFDLSQVRVLQEDQNSLATRWTTLVQGGIGTLSEARSALGMIALPAAKKDAINLDPTQVRLAAQAGFITVNEARASFGLATITEGDVPLPVYLMDMGSGGMGIDVPLLDTPPSPLALPAPKALQALGTKARKPTAAQRRQAIERKMEKELKALLMKDYEAVASRIAA